MTSTNWNIVPDDQRTVTGMDFVVCACGHGIHDHDEGGLACTVKKCGCEEWVDADPDDDWVAGEDCDEEDVP